MEFSQIIETLRAQEQELEAQLTKVRAAREALESTSGSPTAAAPMPARRGRRPGRPRKNPAASAGATKSAGRRGSHRFSADTRAKMAAAQRARWAKVKSEQNKK